MVKLAGSYEFDAPKDAVWEALQDPEVLSRVLPGCKQLDKIAENEYRGEISIRVGPVQGSFNGSVNLSNIDPPNGYQMDLAGQGRPGFIKGSGRLRLDGDTPTTLHYDGDAQLSGRIASVGQRLVDSTARSLTRQGLQSLDKIIAARLEAVAPEPADSAAMRLSRAEALSNQSPANGADSVVPQVASQGEKASEESADDTARAPDPSHQSAQPDVVTPSTMEVGINVAKDVVTDLVQEFQRTYSGRSVLFILVGFAAIVWMWRQLFGGGSDAQE